MIPSDSIQLHQSKRATYFFAGLTIAAIVVGVVHASWLWYVNDDCFVSFRYAKNLIKGLGLVYNACERVEGYTNFLWTMVVAFGLKLKADPVMFSTTLGIIFYASTLALYAFLSWRFRGVGTSQQFLIPLTTIALCLHREFSAHATSGMETSMFSFLISCSFATLILGKSKRSHLLAGLLLVLAMMTRPDGFIFFASAALFVLLTRRKPWNTIVVFLVPAIVIFLPYWIWRWSYFGYFFPNAFYAKSVSLPYYTQGFVYTWLYFKTYYVLFLLPILWLFFLRKWWKSEGRQNFFATAWKRLRGSLDESHPLLLATLFIISYILFVIRIGGDFMFARFFIAVTPIMYFSIELLLRQLTARRFYLLLVAVVLVGTLARWNQYGDKFFIGYIADESRYFTKEDQAHAEVDGNRLHQYFGELPVRLAFWAGQIRIAYYIDPSYAIECSGGLTDIDVAHQEISTRGYPGHEKQPTLDLLIRKHVNFDIGVTPPPPGQFVVNAIWFRSVIARIIIYDDSIMTKLSQYPDIHFTRFPEYLDAYIASMKTYPLARVEEDYRFFKSYYFDHNRDTSREEAFLAFLNRAATQPTTAN